MDLPLNIDCLLEIGRPPWPADSRRPTERALLRSGLHYTPLRKLIASVHPDPLTRTRSLMARGRGIDVTTIWKGTPTHSPVGPAIFQDFLPEALREGRLRPAPDPTITGTSLRDIPRALEVLRAGVSASKLVLTLTVPGAE